MKPLPALLLLATAALGAEETFTHRVTGLFAPEREADLRAAVEKLPDIRLLAVDFAHAEAQFAYDPAIAFKGVKPAEIPKRFDERIRGISSSTFGIQPLVATPREQLTRVEIPVAGLDCKACCLGAYEAVAKLDGVAQATASFREGRITALIDPAKTSRAALEEALRKRNVTLRAE